MSRSRNLADLLSSSGDVLLAHLDNATSVTVTDNVTSTSTTEALSANQGKALKDLVDGKQADDAQLTDVAGLAVTDGNFIVGNGSNFVAESAGTARTSLGLAIGTNVQAYDADLATLATNGIGTSANQLVQLDGTAKLPAVDGSNLTGVDSLPTQTSQSGKFLTTNGSAASWGEAGGGAWEFIESISASGASTVDLEGFSSSYDHYMVVMYGVYGSATTRFSSRFKIGGSYVTSPYNYNTHRDTSNQAYSSDYSGSSAYMAIGQNNAISTTGDSGRLDSIAYIFDANNTSRYKSMISSGRSGYQNTRIDSSSTLVSSSHLTAVQGIQFLGDSGTVTGEFYMYGLSKS